MRTPRDRVTVCFGNYDPKQRTTLIRFFRTRLTESAQHDWERYWLGHWTMFDEPDRTDPERVAAQIRHARRRTDVLFLVGGILIVAVGVLSKWLQGVEHVSLGQTIAACLVGGVLWALLWTTMRSGVCPRGQVAERFPDPSAVDPVILVGLVCFVVTWVVVLTCLKLDRAPRTNILLGGAGLWGVLTLWGLTRQTRRLRGWNEEAARLAAEKYLAASPVAPQRPDSDA